MPNVTVTFFEQLWSADTQDFKKMRQNFWKTQVLRQIAGPCLEGWGPRAHQAVLLREKECAEMF